MEYYQFLSTFPRRERPPYVGLSGSVSSFLSTFPRRERLEDFELFQELINEFEAYKKLYEFVKNAERFYTNEDYFKIILKAISKCKDKYLADNAVHCLSYLKYQLEGNPALKVEELKEGMWVWDDVLKKYIHILTIDFGVPSGGLIETENEYVPFEERRFYRKQVKE